MKALICGNAPCLPKQLIGLDLSDYFVVRMNGWRKIEGADNRCDAWSCWPFQTMKPTNRFYWDPKKYAQNTKELWYAHAKHSQERAEICYGRKIDYCFPLNEALKLQIEIGSAPEMGMLMIRMVQLKTDNITVAGFDHYQDPDSDYYFPEGKGIKLVHSAHNHINDRIWFEKQKLSTLPHIIA